jgi:hypothetical protein
MQERVLHKAIDESLTLFFYIGGMFLTNKFLATEEIIGHSP